MGEKVKVTVLDPSGSRDIPVGIPIDWTVDRFISEFKKKLGLPAGANYTAELKRTNSLLDPMDTINRAGIQEGDVIRLRHEVKGGR